MLTAFAPNALADKITISGNDNYRAGQGGEFNIRAADAAGAALLANNLSSAYKTSNGTTVGTADGTRMYLGSDGLAGFETFCIEHNEYISLEGTYEASISNGSIYGGNGGGVDPDGGGPLPKTDTISLGTAYLYKLFATGALNGYTYTLGGGRPNSAVMLQEAFWYLEDEISLTDPQKAANTFLTGAFTQFGGEAGAKADNNFSLYNVRVMNLGTLAGPAQDQLIMVPDGGLTSLLLGLGMSGLALLRAKSQ